MLLVTLFVANQIVLQILVEQKFCRLPDGQVLELIYLPTDIFRLPWAIGQALVSNTEFIFSVKVCITIKTLK